MSSLPADSCSRIQLCVADLLDADPYFSDIPIIALDTAGFTKAQIDVGSTDQIFNAGLAVTTGKTSAATKAGAAVLIATPTVRAPFPNVQGPEFGKVQLMVRALEAPVLNRGAAGIGKTALQIAQYVSAILHQRTVLYTAGSIYAADAAITLGDDPKFLSFDANFFTEDVFQYAPAQAPTPSFSNITGTGFVIHCADATAQIYYTRDQSLPTPTNGLGPSVDGFAFTDGAGVAGTWLARAYKTGQRASEIYKITL